MSGSATSTNMVGADATITWINAAMGTANAVDYLLTARSPVSTEVNLKKHSIVYSATSLKSKFLNFWDYDVLCEVSLELGVTKRPDLVRM